MLGAFVFEAPAATLTWLGDGGANNSKNDLTDNTAWLGNTLPSTNDNAEIVFNNKQAPAATLTNKTTDTFSVQNLTISNLAARVDSGAGGGDRIDTITFKGPVTLSSNLVVGAMGGLNNYSLSVFFSNTTSMLNGTFNGAQLGTTAGKTAAATLTFGGTTSIKSNLTFNGNTGFSVLNIGGTTTIGSNLTFTGGTGTNLLQITNPTTVSNNFAITGDAGAAASNLVTVTGDLTVLKTLSLTNGSSRNTLTLDAANINLGTLTVSGSGATPYLVVGAGRTITISNDFTTDSLNLTNGTLKVGGALTINTLNANRAGFQAQNGTITFNGGGSRIQTAEVASVGGRKPRVMARRILSEILQPRAEEIFHLVWDEIRRAGYEKSLNSGIVLTGGGAILDGMPEIAEQIFDLPIRRGTPAGVGGLADHVNSPTFATGVGLVLYAYRNSVGDSARATVGAGALVRAAGRLRGLFREFF